MTNSENIEHDIDEASEPARIAVRNIGGITDCEIELPPGVTVLSGGNATNRTSLLSAVIGALGGEMATLKSDAEEGAVELHFGGRTYTRIYTRQGDTVTTSGTPLSDDGDVVDLYVGLIEQNRARQAIHRGDDLRDAIMRPVDTEEIQRRIGETERERQRIESKLDDINRRRDRLPSLQERRESLEADLEELTAELEAVRGTVEEYDTSETEAQRAESLLDEVDGLREERDRLEEEIETQRTSVEALREEREAIESEIDELAVDESSLGELDRRIERLRTRKRELEDLLSDLSAIVEVNDELVNSSTTDLPGIEAGGQDPTSALDPMSAEIECWTCGNRVPKGAIADRLDELRQVIDEQQEKRRSVADELEEAEEQRAEIQAVADTRDELETRLREVERRIEQREKRLTSLREDRKGVQRDIEHVETRLEEGEEFEDTELVEQYQRVSDLEYERGQLEQQLTELETEIGEIERVADEKQQLEAQRNELREEIEDLRSRIDELERSAVEQFNGRMADILDLLEYDNLERVWIERKTDTSGRGETKIFDLHVVRESATGAVYEDTIETVSESEREIIGLVVGLAGYLVHEVHTDVPFMLLDSLEAIDANRINKLLDYFAGYVPYFVVALLPEDAEVLSIDHSRVFADALEE